jgi:hypothetical protein
VEVLANLNVLLYDEAFFGFSSYKTIANGLGFGAVENSKFIKRMLLLYNDVSFYKKDGTLDFSAHIAIQDAALNDCYFARNNSLQLKCNIRIYPTDVFAPMNYYCNPVAYTKNTLTAHHYNVSWHGAEEMDKRRIRMRRDREFWNKYSIVT